MTTLLMILIVVTVVVFALGFGCGWWVRNAKVKEWEVWADELVKTAKALHDEAARIAPDQVKPWAEYECKVILMSERRKRGHVQG